MALLITEFLVKGRGHKGPPAHLLNNAGLPVLLLEGSYFNSEKWLPTSLATVSASVGGGHSLRECLVLSRIVQVSGNFASPLAWVHSPTALTTPVLPSCRRNSKEKCQALLPPATPAERPGHEPVT